MTDHEIRQECHQRDQERASGARKSSIVMTCAIVACVVTLITSGTLIGNVQSDVRASKGDIKEIKGDVKAIKVVQTDIKSKQSFLEGVVSTQLTTIQESVVRTEKRVDGLMRTPNPVPVP